MPKDYYKILEIHPQASPEVMNKAYRALVQKFHPDQYHVSNKARMEERMREINEAYDILSDPSRREKYDRTYESLLSSSSTQSLPKKGMGNILKWFVISVAVALVLGSGLKFLLLNPLVRILVLIAIVMFGYRTFVNR